MSYDQGPQPILRCVRKIGEKWFEKAAFYKNTNPNSRAAFSGYIDLLGQGRQHVFGFINPRRDGEGVVISLTASYTDPTSGEMGRRTVALGSVVNQRADGGEVYFDTMLFNPLDEEEQRIDDAEPVAVYVTDECDSDLHRQLGFREARRPRPKRETSHDQSQRIGD
uniref:hypothetical protein n=1 Tax=Cupriavidus gilardii TaxID=82541 RepID=UPI00247B1B63|nr:hypothetical protein [Cupriavidus gilardii]WDE72570.1 hypothetical protein [Cupriavidus gilardii]